MAADPSVYQQFLRPVRSVSDYGAEMDARDMNALQLVAARRQNELAGFTLDQQKMQAQQGIARQNALQALASDPRMSDPLARESAMLNNPLLSAEGQALRKSRLDAEKLSADTGKTNYETQKAQREEAIQHIGAFQTPQEAIASLQAAKDIPPQMKEALLRSIPQDPALFPQWQLRVVLSLAKPNEQAAGMAPKMQNAGGSIVNTNPLAGNVQPVPVTQSPDNAATNTRAAAEGAANRSVQMRGQNMTDARARETTAASLTKPFEVTGPDGLPLLVQQDKQGNIRPVQGFGPKSGASKPLNDTQAKALLFGTRMQEANKVLEGLEGKYSPAAVNAKVSAEGTPLVGGVAGMIGNTFLSGEGQQAEQAQRDFINAVLRRESGAVISDSEFSNAAKQYFPQPSDKPGTLAQKKRNRELAIKGLLAEVPEGRRNSITPGQQEPAAPREVNFSDLK